ncbi:MAG: GerMN domain-containing protein [Clostridiaceae bacterium]|jgi:germination protein M|nr:GerMN domain-containing protein [Clostridiaceae bacterium]
MKRIVLFTLLFVLVLSSSACSLLNDKDAAEGTQQNKSELTTEQGMTEDEAVNNASEESTSVVDTGDAEVISSSEEMAIYVTLYFPTIDNSALIKEDRDILVSDGEILKASILALAEGPKAQGQRTPIPEGTQILGISIKDKVAIVDFSNEFLHANGLEEITNRLSVVNTLTQIEGVEKVRLHIDGEDMIGPSGMPLGDMEPAQLNPDGTPTAGKTVTATLFFSDSEAMYLVGEKRDVTIFEGETLEAAVIRELIEGPGTDSLWSAIPEGARLLSASTKKGLCTVDFSAEFVDNSPGGTASERMAIGSVVNTLTQLEGVEKVQFLIDGKKREIYTHAIFDEPFSRFEDLIAK